MTSEEEIACEAATCSQCLARTYPARGEECVCLDGGDAEVYEEVLDRLMGDSNGANTSALVHASAE